MTAEEAVKQFTPFVWKMAKRFRHHDGVELEDLVQVGLLAVAGAAPLWSEEGGASMLTWIRRPVLNAMSKHVRNGVAHGINRRCGKANRMGRGARVRHMSMDQPLTESQFGKFNCGENQSATLHDVIGSFEEPPDFLALRQLPGALARLRRQERQVIRLRFVDGLTLHEVGDRLGFSRERARQIEASALGKLRTLVKGDTHVSA